VITIGIDPHKDTHTAAAVEDATGQLLGELTVPGTEAGHRRLLAWAHDLDEEQRPRFALEDCRHVNGRLERFLLAAGETVLRVGTRLSAHARQGARTYGKSDSIDALAVARAALREPGLPQATHDPKLRELKLLVDHRDDLVGERTAHSMRLRWHLHDLDSGLEPFARTLNDEKVRRGLSQRLGRYGEGVQVRISRELLVRIGELTRAIDALRKEKRWRARWPRRCWRSPASASWSPRASSSRPAAAGASAQTPRLPATPAARRSRSPPGAPAATGSCALATVS
jgi:transposase